MKPFNLEAALSGAKVITRDGRDVQAIAHFPDAYRRQRVVACIDGKLYEYDKDGYIRDVGIRADDLVMAPQSAKAG